MCLNCGLLALTAAALWAAPLPAAGLTRVDRTIAKEPAYRSKPKYCLLVLGPEARTRVWLVLDGPVLYVDRNADRDLTQPDERFSGADTPGDARKDYPFAAFRQFPTIDQLPARGEKKYTRVHVVHTMIKKAFAPRNRADRELQARFAQDPTLARVGITLYLDDKVRVQAVCEWADRPADAPICHVGGPLTLAPLQSQELRREGGSTELQFCLGFRGLAKAGEDPFAILDYDRVPAGVEPVAAFRFANKELSRPPLTVEVKLKRC